MLSHQGLEPVNVYAHAVWAAAAVPGPATFAYPAVKGEVRRLSQVEPVVEATMVRSGKRDHELASFLKGYGEKGIPGMNAPVVTPRNPKSVHHRAERR